MIHINLKLPIKKKFDSQNGGYQDLIELWIVDMGLSCAAL